jgi:3'-5' exoribonuclease
MAGRTFVKDLKAGAPVEGTFLVAQKEVRQKKTGGDYLYMALRDKTGTVTAFMWDGYEPLLPKLEVGTYLKVSAMVQKYNNRTQIVVRKAELVEPGAVESAEFLPATALDTGVLWAEIEGRIAAVKDPFLRRLLADAFAGPGVREAFLKAPAAKIMHHSCVGGLIEHTHSLLKLCDLVAGYYPQLDADLLAAGAILHDWGKTRELSSEGAFDYTREGRLVGHIVMTAQEIERLAGTIPDFPADLKANLTHLIISHHGQYDFGSPKMPKLREALVLSQLDSLDSHLKGFDEDLADAEEGSAYSDIMGRYIFETNPKPKA